MITLYRNSEEFMDYIINFFNEQSMIVKIIIVLILVFIYSMFCVLLNKLNAAKNGKATVLAWIPIFNICLLGKLTVHVIIGFLLVLGLLFGIFISVDIPMLEKIHNIIPNEYVLPYQIGYAVIVLLFFLLAKLKLNKIVASGQGKDEMMAYITKDFDEKKPEIVVDTTPVNEIPVHDNLSLNSLNQHVENNNSVNNENK